MSQSITTAQQAYKRHAAHWDQGAIDNYKEQIRYSQQHLVDIQTQTKRYHQTLDKMLDNYAAYMPDNVAPLQQARDKVNQAFNQGRFAPQDGAALKASIQKANRYLFWLILINNSKN